MPWDHQRGGRVVAPPLIIYNTMNVPLRGAYYNAIHEARFHQPSDRINIELDPSIRTPRAHRSN